MAFAKRKVLLVEDDSFLSGMYAAKLEREGFQVMTAENGEQGWQLAQTSAPDLMLLDIIMPGMDGFQVLEKLQADPKTKSIPVILLTNLGKKEDVDRGLALGAKDYLIKAHFMPSEVITKIKRLLPDG